MDKILLLSLQKEFPPRECVLTPVSSPVCRYLVCTAVRSKNSPPVPARNSNKHCKFQLPTGTEDKAPFRVLLTAISMKLLLKASWTKHKEMSGLYKLNSNQMWPDNIHSEHNYPEEFAFSAIIQKAVEWDQILPTQESSSIQGTAEVEERRYRKGSCEESFHSSLSSRCSQALSINKIPGPQNSGKKSTALNLVLFYHQLHFYSIFHTQVLHTIAQCGN